MVRQQPFTAMLFETASDGATDGAWIVTRPPSSFRSSASIAPVCSIIPVNINDSDGSRIRVYSISRLRQKALDCFALDALGQRRGRAMKACLLRAPAAIETNP